MSKEAPGTTEVRLTDETLDCVPYLNAFQSCMCSWDGGVGGKWGPSRNLSMNVINVTTEGSRGILLP